MKKPLHFFHYIRLFIVLFNVFSLLPDEAFAQFDFGKSYINVTKGLNGGTVETGDTLEIRASIVVRRNGSSDTRIDNCVYYDAVPAGTTYIPGTIRVLTNEGKIFRQFTDASGDDPGYINGSDVRINLGYTAGDNPATATSGGRIRNTHIPNFGNSCIMLASFRVVVTSAIGTQINTGGGRITYRRSYTNYTFDFPSNTVAVYTNYGICSNTIGVNSLGTESNGSFGSGTVKDRDASSNVPAGYTYSTFSAYMPNDYYYGVSNNTSTGGGGFSTSDAWAKPDNSSPSHRVFNLWDIIGDHTGAADPLMGNPATENGEDGGYMLVVNAAYKIDSAFQHTITGLCPNTFYEISFWMRNICSLCGTDMNGVNASSGNTAYIPTDVGDSSGVNPNLSFDINGIDYYTTGNLKYTGQWVKKGFTYLTGPAENSITLKIMNNAPGGGGNDWALDDITVATCSPDFTFTPTPNPTVCDNNLVNMGATISSFFPNYTHYKWQRSDDNGTTWYDTGIGSPPLGVPVWNGTSYEYSITYPPFIAYAADDSIRFRVIVSTTEDNLAIPNCQFSDASTHITLNVIDCGNPLNTDIISFTSQNNNNMPVLTWTTNMEVAPYIFEVERSMDSRNFTTIGRVASNGNLDAQINTYSFTDNTPIPSAYYRIKMTGNSDFVKYSRIIRIAAAENELSLTTIVNPFYSHLDFYMTAPLNSNGEAWLFDNFGRPVKTMKLSFTAGNNHFVFSNTQDLPAGTYTLYVKALNKTIAKPVIKFNR